MANFAACVLLPLSLLSFAVEAVASPKVFSVPFQKREHSGRLSKRAGYLTETLNNYLPLNEYFATVTVGTPPQTLELVIDTGSSDIWFFGTGACDVEASGGACEGGSYSSSASSTYTLLAKGDFYIQYVTAGSGVLGDYIADNFGIGGVTVQNLTMAVATQANETTTGIMGIGLDTDEAISQYGGSYSNLPDLLLSQGLISSKSYSLYLDDLASGSGQVLFGGYDKNKFTGDLIMLPLQNDSSSPSQIIDSFAVAWTSLSLTDTNGTITVGSSEYPAAAILDSGTTLTYLPQDIFDSLADFFGATYNNDFEAYLVPCDIGKVAGQINYGFGGANGPVIPVPFAELAPPTYNLNGRVYDDREGEEVCVFGIQPNTAGDPILFGQTFLRSAYVMYDLTNLQAGLAPTVFDSTTSNIVEYSNRASGGSITTDTSGPTVTIASAADEPGNPYNVGTSASVTYALSSSAYYGGLSSSGALSYSTNTAITSLRSYPSDTIPTREASSLMAVTNAAEATGAAAAGSGTAAAASATSTSGAGAVMVPGRSLSIALMSAGTLVLMMLGGLLIL